MKKIKFNYPKFKKYLLGYLITFATIFTSMIVCYSLISMLVFNQFHILFFHLGVILIVSLILSFMIELFVQINKISLGSQTTIIYTTIVVGLIALVLYVLSFYINLNDVSMLMLFCITVPSSFIGLGVVMLIIFLIKRREEKTLNDELLRFKGNNKNEQSKACRNYCG